MKIGIISEFNLNTVNFGNHLQAYALNAYLRAEPGVRKVDSIALCGKQMGQHTNMFSLAFLQKAFGKLLGKFIKEKETNVAQFDKNLFHARLAQFEEFRNRDSSWSIREMNSQDLLQSDYDAFIVGSDVVWAQYPLWISRTKFLAFSSQKPFKRIAYAASFGNDYIPKENVKYIRNYLSKFDAISVREHSSVDMLSSIHVNNAEYCLDPTLLLTAEQWERIEKKPETKVDEDGYIFVYLLGDDTAQRQRITEFAHRKNLKIVTIPNANGFRISADKDFGDIPLADCSVENWIWLIHHAEYIFTDSFHGTVFSTIFEKRFWVLKRYGSVNINNRMQDYLREIAQQDKWVGIDALRDLEDFVWDYSRINAAIDVRRTKSIQFLTKALGESYV